MEPPTISEITNSTRKIKNRILAIPAALAAMPVNPNSPAIKATTKNINDQRNIASVFLKINNYTRMYYKNSAKM